MSKTLNYFSEARIALINEVKRHDRLLELLAELPKDDWPAQIAEIAAYAGVWLDGDYYMIELEPLYVELNFKLKKLRGL